MCVYIYIYIYIWLYPAIKPIDELPQALPIEKGWNSQVVSSYSSWRLDTNLSNYSDGLLANLLDIKYILLSFRHYLPKGLFRLKQGEQAPFKITGPCQLAYLLTIFTHFVQTILSPHTLKEKNWYVEYFKFAAFLLKKIHCVTCLLELLSESRKNFIVWKKGEKV